MLYLSEDASILLSRLVGDLAADGILDFQSFSFSSLRMFFRCVLDFVIAVLCGFPRMCLGVGLFLFILLAPKDSCPLSVKILRHISSNISFPSFSQFSPIGAPNCWALSLLPPLSLLSSNFSSLYLSRSYLGHFPHIHLFQILSLC